MVASCYATSIAGRQTLGRPKGAKLQRMGADPDAPWVDARGPLQAPVDGFDPHAAVYVAAQRPEGRLPLESCFATVRARRSLRTTCNNSMTVASPYD